MSRVVASEHFGIELRPHRVARRQWLAVAERKRMTRGAEGHQRLARGEKAANRRELLDRQGPPPDTQDRCIGIVEHFNSRNHVPLTVVSIDQTDAKITPKVLSRKLRQRLLRPVLVFRHHDRQVQPPVSGRTSTAYLLRSGPSDGRRQCRSMCSITNSVPVW